MEEYNYILKNDLQSVVPRLKDKAVVSSKYMYKIKHAGDGSVQKYKARFVAHGFSHKEGLEYEETISPVVRYTSIREMMALVEKMKRKIYQMDVKMTFLNGIIEKEVYIDHPHAFEVEEC